MGKWASREESSETDNVRVEGEIGAVVSNLLYSLSDCRVVEMLTVDVDGVTLFYEEKGSGEPVLFCHGIPTDYRAWLSQIEIFSHSYRAISYSRRYAAPNMREGDLTDSTVGNNAGI